MSTSRAIARHAYQVPSCHSVLTAPPKLYGKTVSCPKCKSRLSIPLPANSAPVSQENQKNVKRQTPRLAITKKKVGIRTPPKVTEKTPAEVDKRGQWMLVGMLAGALLTIVFGTVVFFHLSNRERIAKRESATPHASEEGVKTESPSPNE